MTTLLQALGRAGNQIVEVDQDNTSQIIGNFNTAPVTSGIYSGYLIIKAAGCDPEAGVYPIDIDARAVRLQIGSSSKRIFFWGFNVLGTPDINGDGISWWYCKFSFPADRATIGSWTNPLYNYPDCVDVDGASNPAFYGCDFTDFAHAIKGSAPGLLAQGCRFRNPYPATPTWNPHNLWAPHGGMTGTVTDCLLDDHYNGVRTGRGVDLETHGGDDGAIDMTFTQSWINGSAAAGVNLIEAAGGSAITYREDPSVRIYDNANIGVNGSSVDGNISIVGSHSQAPGTGTDPAMAWRAANPSDSLVNFAFGIRQFDDGVVARSFLSNVPLGFGNHVPNNWAQTRPILMAKVIGADGFCSGVRHDWGNGDSGSLNEMRTALTQCVANGGTSAHFCLQPGWPGLTITSPVGNVFIDESAADPGVNGAILQNALATAAAAIRDHLRSLLGTTLGNAFVVRYSGLNEPSQLAAFSPRREALTHWYRYHGLKAGDPLCRVSPSTSINSSATSLAGNVNRSNVHHVPLGNPGDDEKWRPFDYWRDLCNTALMHVGGTATWDLGFGVRNCPAITQTGFDFIDDHSYSAGAGSVNAKATPLNGTYKLYTDAIAALDAYGLDSTNTSNNGFRWVPWIAQMLYDELKAQGWTTNQAMAMAVVTISETGFQHITWRADAAYPLNYGVTQNNAKYHARAAVPAGHAAPASNNTDWAREWSGGTAYSVGTVVWDNRNNAQRFWRCTVAVSGNTPPANDPAHWADAGASTVVCEGGSWMSEESAASQWLEEHQQFFAFKPTVDGIWLGGPNAQNNPGGAKSQRNLTDALIPYEGGDLPTSPASKFGFLYWGTRQAPDQTNAAFGEKGYPTAADGAYRKLLAFSNQPDPRFFVAVVNRPPSKIQTVGVDVTSPLQAGFLCSAPTDPGVPATITWYRFTVDATAYYSQSPGMIVQPLSAGNHVVVVSASNDDDGTHVGATWSPPSDPLTFTVSAQAPRNPGQIAANQIGVDVSIPLHFGALWSGAADGGVPNPGQLKWRVKLDNVQIAEVTSPGLASTVATAGAHTLKIAQSNNNGSSYGVDSPAVAFTVADAPIITDPTRPTPDVPTPAGQEWRLAVGDEFDDTPGNSGPVNGLRTDLWNKSWFAANAPTVGTGVQNQTTTPTNLSQMINYHAPDMVTLPGDGRLHLKAAAGAAFSGRTVKTGAVNTGNLMILDPLGHSGPGYDDVNFHITGPLCVEVKFKGPGPTGSGGNDAGLFQCLNTYNAGNCDNAGSYGEVNAPGQAGNAPWRAEIDLMEALFGPLGSDQRYTLHQGNPANLNTTSYPAVDAGSDGDDLSDGDHIWTWYTDGSRQRLWFDNVEFTSRIGVTQAQLAAQFFYAQYLMIEFDIHATVTLPVPRDWEFDYVRIFDLTDAPPSTANNPPTTVSAIAGDGVVEVSWLPAAEAECVEQRITSSLGTSTIVAATETSAFVNSPNGVAVTFTVARAIPALGGGGVVYGAESVPSSPVTPQPTIVQAPETVWSRVGRLRAGP